MKSILVIEDHQEVRENIGEILGLAGYAVLLAPDGKKGIELATRDLPDLILCDVMMPELDGFGVLKILRANKRTHNIPFIFLTAKSEKEDFRKGMGLGADDYITKPFDDVDMLRTIEMRLERSDHIKHQFEVPGSGLARRVDKEELISRVLKDQETKRWNSGYILYSPGESARDIYYIKSGSLKEVMENELGKSLIIDFYFAGEFVGFEDALYGKNRTTEMTAFEDAKVVRISKERLLQLVGQDREIAGLFMNLLAERLQKVKRDMLAHAYASVRKRIADTLCNFAIKYPQSNNGKPTIYLSREDLANKAGTAKETVIRTLSDFKEEGLIRIDARKITLVSPEKLRQIPN